MQLVLIKDKECPPSRIRPGLYSHNAVHDEPDCLMVLPYKPCSLAIYNGDYCLLPENDE